LYKKRNKNKKIKKRKGQKDAGVDKRKKTGKRKV
jgi:hypothetical protein